MTFGDIFKVLLVRLLLQNSTRTIVYVYVYFIYYDWAQDAKQKSTRYLSLRWGYGLYDVIIAKKRGNGGRLSVKSWNTTFISSPCQIIIVIITVTKSGWVLKILQQMHDVIYGRPFYKNFPLNLNVSCKLLRGTRTWNCKKVKLRLTSNFWK